MNMSGASASSIAAWFAIYFIVWWLVLFVTLPFGVRSRDEAGEAAVAGTDPGAPAAHMLKKKALITTVIAAIAMPILIYLYRLLEI